jgi:hypothetical protein
MAAAGVNACSALNGGYHLPLVLGAIAAATACVVAVAFVCARTPDLVQSKVSSQLRSETVRSLLPDLD